MEQPIPNDVVVSDDAVWRFIEGKVGPHYQNKEVYTKLVEKYIQKANDERRVVVAKRQEAHKTYLREIDQERQIKNYSFHGPDKREITKRRVPFQDEYRPLRMIDIEELLVYSSKSHRPNNPFTPAFPKYIITKPAAPSKPSFFESIRSFFAPLGH